MAAIWGMLTNVVPFLLFGGGVEQQIATARSLGIPLAIAVGSTVLLPSLWAGTSIGLWWGRPQGWWCASFLYSERLLQYGWLLSLDLSRAAGARTVSSHVTILVAVVVQGLVLYRINSRTWTGVGSWPLKWLVLIPVLAVFAFYAIISAVRGLLLYL
jgi:hypothetical protein